jgi:peroxiredoxin
MTLRVLLQYFSKLLGKKPVPALRAGNPAPTFELATAMGERLSLPQALAGGPVLLAFFKVACPTCQLIFPFLERMYQQLLEQRVQIWGVVQDKAQDGRRFAGTYSVTFPILVDDSPYQVSRAYGLTHVPSLFLVQPNGRIEICSDGFCKADLLAIQRSLAQALSATPPALFLPSEKIPEFKPG